MNRTAPSGVQQRRRNIERRAKSTEAVEFFNVLTSPELLQTTEALLPEHRERLYPPTVTLSMFMRQVLEADGSCQKAVNVWAAERAADGLRACSVRTGGYCRARQRLPLGMVSTLARQTGRLLSQKARPHWLWRGRAVKLVDGTGLSMPDTPENQAVYPQPSTQATGVGFPLARLVVVICLATDWPARGVDPSVLTGATLISGIFDPTPVMSTTVNEQLLLTAEMARRHDVERRAPLIKCPTALIAGGLEPAQWVDQSFRYFHHLRRHGLNPEVHVLDGQDHFGILAEYLKPDSITVRVIRRHARLTDAV
jgi:hypothetical protein